MSEPYTILHLVCLSYKKNTIGIDERDAVNRLQSSWRRTDIVIDTTIAGLIGTIPVEAALSTYDFVATSVAFVVVPLIVIILVVKFPDALRATIVEAVFDDVAAFAAVAPDATLAAVTPPTRLTTVAVCVPVTSPISDPVKFVAFVAVVAVVGFVAEVAVVALPVKFAVIVPALKFPFVSL